MFQASASSYAQRITLSKSQQSLTETLKEIRRQSGYSLLYDTKTLKKASPVNVNLVNVSLEEALTKCFSGQPFSYLIKGTTIIVTPAPNSGSITREAIKVFTVNGKVTDVKGQPIPGVNVQLKGTKTGAVTNDQGQYQLNLPDGNGTLTFSFVGYLPQEIQVNNQPKIDITLTEAASILADVVVVGYGTQKKTTLTGSVSQISGDALTKRPVANFQQALQGQAPGLTVLDLGGAPGRSEASIRVRGITTFNVNSSSTSGGYDLSKNDALVIVDGIEQRLTDINPDDIESVSILKDASSTAIYGSRATNGVLLITTKRAKTGKVALTLNNYYATQNSINTPESMNIESYMRLEQQAYINAGANVPAKFTDQGITTWVNATDREKYPNAFARAPYMIRFQSGWLNFDICTVHIYYGKETKTSPEYLRRVEEIRNLVSFLEGNYITKGRSNNMFVLGDFNIEDNKSPTYAAATSAAFAIPDAILKANLDGTNVKRDKIYDQILYHNKYNDIVFKQAGIFDFYDTVFNNFGDYSTRIAAHIEKKIEDGHSFDDFKTYQMSDHLPLWVEMNTDHADSYLNMIINKKDETVTL